MLFGRIGYYAAYQTLQALSGLVRSDQVLPARQGENRMPPSKGGVSLLYARFFAHTESNSNLVLSGCEPAPALITSLYASLNIYIYCNYYNTHAYCVCGVGIEGLTGFLHFVQPAGSSHGAASGYSTSCGSAVAEVGPACQARYARMTPLIRLPPMPDQAL